MDMMRSIFAVFAILGYVSAYGKARVSRINLPALSVTDRLSCISHPVFIFSKNAAPSFVPRSHGVVSPLPKQVVASQVYGTRASKSSSGAASVKMMPIGVPKVAYRVPGSQQADW